MSADKIIDFQDCISVGQIVKTIGLKGFVKVIPFADDPERFSVLKRVFLYDEKARKFFKNTVTNTFEFYPDEISYNKGFIRMNFKDLGSIEAVEIFKDAFIAVPEEERITLRPGEFFLYEVIGFDVYDKGKYLGKVKGFSDYGSGDLFVIDSIDNKEVLIPAKKEFITRIDKEKKQIILNLIEGFFDL